MNIKKVISSIGVGAGAIIIAFGLQYAMAQTWSGAPSNPPTCPSTTAGCNAPINVGSSYQAKSGGLALGTSTVQSSMLDVEGIGYLQSLILGKNSGSTFQYLDGNQAAGKVLTSDASGNASWATPPAGGSSNGFVFINPIVVASIPQGTREPWTRVSLSSLGVPATASAVIFQVEGYSYSVSIPSPTAGEIDVSSSLSSPAYTLLSMGLSDGFNMLGAQGIFPIINDSFYYKVPNAFGEGSGTFGASVPNTTISVIGYYIGPTPATLTANTFACYAAEPPPGGFKSITTSGAITGGVGPYIYQFYAPYEAANGSPDNPLLPLTLNPVPGTQTYGTQNLMGHYDSSYVQVTSSDNQTVSVNCTYPNNTPVN